MVRFTIEIQGDVQHHIEIQGDLQHHIEIQGDVQHHIGLCYNFKLRFLYKLKERIIKKNCALLI